MLGSYTEIATLKKKKKSRYHHGSNFGSVAWVPTMAQREPLCSLTYLAP